MKIEKSIVVNTPIDHAWKVFVTDFNDAHEWMASVYNSYERPEGGGRVCNLSTKENGLRADETITRSDATNHVFAFTVHAQNAGALPVKENHNTITMKKLGEHTTEVVWTAEPKPTTAGKFLSLLLKVGLGKVFGEVLEEFKYYAETGKPHPKKIQAMEKVT